jgi:hypothetical protein
MSLHQRIASAIIAILFLTFVVEMVRRRKLGEEYSLLWSVAGLIMIGVVIWYDFLEMVTELIGASMPTTTLFIFAIIFLLVVSIHLSMKVSKQARQIKNLAQRMAIKDGEPEIV